MVNKQKIKWRYIQLLNSLLRYWFNKKITKINTSNKNHSSNINDKNTEQRCLQDKLTKFKRKFKSKESKVVFEDSFSRKEIVS